jgi:hypothetical protein
MNDQDALIEALSKFHRREQLGKEETDLLREWVAESPEHSSLLDSLGNDNAPRTENPAMMIREKLNGLDSLKNNGSANAFEGTETFREYEKDMSDDELDQLLSE